ncbi:hypothetical protein F4823DRAFT_569216 [Ustulina deusta]|nr:hypothetical protein F4823DRAFT_569216 [Ustulina deusta]
MRKLQHPHLISALAAYERGEDRGFVFPWADGGNLQQFWEKDGIDVDDSLLYWALKQISGLVDGIEKLHGKGTRHGDIKPANIVILKNGANDEGNLVIADVGLAKFHATYTRERFVATTTKYGSRRYEPPEVQSTTTKFSRKYDIWSFGCTFLEFLIWLLYGPKVLQSFFIESKENVSDDRYWSDDSLRPVITNWMKKLSADLAHPGAWKDLLDLIKTRLLIVDVDSRADSNELLQEIQKIESNSALDSSYLFDPALRELARNRRQLASLPATSTNMSLSENRTSKLRDVWENVTDNELAHRILLVLQRSSPLLEKKPSSTLCLFCQTLDLKSHIIDLNRNTDEVRDNAGFCDCCKLLNYCLSKRNIVCTKPLQLFREGSVLYVSGKSPPLVSIYSNLEHNTAIPSYAQIGLPELPEVASSQQFQLLKEWVRLCDETHECTRIQTDAATPLKMPTRVVDVGSGNNTCLRLIAPSNTMKEKYIALSHCWGKIHQNLNFIARKGNIDRLMYEISFNQLPRTFQDAVRTTRALGIRYLWIDSLCIVQDDENDWNIEAKKMEDIYSCAYVTIAASSATSSLDGFLVNRPSRVYATVATPDGSFCLAEAIDNFVEDVEEGILNTRGWVLQERALSRRIIHFTSTQIYWECGEGVHCETLAQLHNPQSQFLGDPDFPRLGLDYFKNERIRLIQHLYALYCALKFTKQNDRSVAISGLLKRLSRTFRMRVDYGIFWKFFERSMLWGARTPGTLSRIDYARDQLMPSWSWMAYSREIGYPDIPFGKVEWTGDLRKPVGAESQDCVCREILTARARKITIEGPDLLERVTLDMDIWSDFEGGRWRCITVGKEKVGSEVENVPHYILLIRPSPVSQSPGLYERVGVGILTPMHFSTELDEVRFMLLDAGTAVKIARERATRSKY